MHNFILQVLLIVPAAFAARPLVTLNDGCQLEGTYQTTLSGQRIDAFLGIRYGNAQRFKNPTPAADTCTHVLDVSTPSPMCLQYNLFAGLQNTESVIGVEDCLFLDVLIPSRPNEKSNLLPVVVLIPSGSFTSLGASSFGGKFLLDKNVVYVTMNSRVGILGYLSTEDNVISGNWGLKDQALALKWVKNNIQAFGGNPNSITLVGESSGAASTHYHLFSTLSKGLFHRAIAMSGSVGNYWSQMPQAKKKAQKLGKYLNCSEVQDSSKLLDCLLSKDGKQITALYEQFVSTSSTPFAPVIEVPCKGAFVTTNPLDAIKNRQSADVPLILSTVTGEGILSGAPFLVQADKIQTLNKSWNSSAPVLLDYLETVDVDKMDFVSQKVRDHYFGTVSVSNETFPLLMKALADRSMTADVTYTALLQAHHSSAPVYSYLFNYFGSANSGMLLGATLKQLEPYGPCHGDDVAYVSNTTYLYTANTEQDIAVVKAMVNLVASFAKTGKPKLRKGGAEWKPVSRKGLYSKTIDYLKINSASDYKMESQTNMGDFEFWQSLPMNEPAAKRAKHR